MLATASYPPAMSEGHERLRSERRAAVIRVLVGALMMLVGSYGVLRPKTSYGRPYFHPSMHPLHSPFEFEDYVWLDWVSTLVGIALCVGGLVRWIALNRKIRALERAQD